MNLVYQLNSEHIRLIYRAGAANGGVIETTNGEWEFLKNLGFSILSVENNFGGYSRMVPPWEQTVRVREKVASE